jgi:hypothetical protein
MVLWRRKPRVGLILARIEVHRIDVALFRQEVGGDSGIVPSIGRAASVLVSAIFESFVASVKT